MRKFLLSVILLLTMLFVGTNVFATNITVDWGPTKDVSFSGLGTFKTTEFDLVFKDTGLETYGYCLEPYASINKKDYEFKIVSLDHNPAKADAYYKAAWILDNFAPGVGKEVTKEDTYKSAAVQSIVWNLLSSSNFTVTTYGKVKTYFDTFMTALSVVEFNTETKQHLGDYFFVGQNSQCQDILLEIPGNPVPEPATMLLLGTGCLVLAGVKRRRTRQ